MSDYPESKATKKVNPRDRVFLFDYSVDTDLTAAINKEHLDICGLRFPASFEGTAVTFLESATEAGAYNAVWWEGALFTLVCAADKTVMFDPAKLSGLKWLKLTCAPVVAADRIVTPIYRDFSG